MAKWWKNLIRIGNPVVNLISSIAGLFKKDSLVGRVFNSGQNIIDSVLDATGSGAVDNFIKGTTGSGLTTAQIEQNEWNAQQAQEQREWTAEMDNTKYQRQTADMQAAGLNPAMMYGQGYTASTPSGTAASGTGGAAPSAGLIDSVLSVIFAKQRMQNLKAEGSVLASQANKNNAEADAARENANSQARQATVAEIRAGIERDLANMNLDIGSWTIDKMAEEIAFIREQRAYISKNYEVAAQNADSLAKEAIAAMRQADASVQNAATQSYKADYETDLLFGETLLNSLIQGEHKEILEKLPDKLRFEVENLQKQGVVLDEEGRLKHRQGNLCTALTVKSYVTTATEVAKTVASFVPAPRNPIGFGK